MEEKKLTDEVVVAKNTITDEEIVKELINESNRGEWCELSFIDCVEVRVLKNALDLINRQKAEIERLTEENEYLDMVARQALADYQNAQVQVDELKEELEKRMKRNEQIFERKLQTQEQVAIGANGKPSKTRRKRFSRK